MKVQLDKLTFNDCVEQLQNAETPIVFNNRKAYSVSELMFDTKDETGWAIVHLLKNFG